MPLTRKRLDTILGHYGEKLPFGMQELVDEIRFLQSRMRYQGTQIKALPKAAKLLHRDGWDLALDAAARVVTLDVCMEIPCLHQGCENDRILARAIRAVPYPDDEA